MQNRTQYLLVNTNMMTNVDLICSLSVALFFLIAPLMAVSVLSVCAAATSCIYYC